MYRQIIFVFCYFVRVINGDCADKFGKIYKPGLEFSDSCQFIKECTGSSQTITRPRCPVMKVKLGCRLISHPKKDEINFKNCCSIEICYECSAGKFGKTSACMGRCHCKDQTKCHMVSGSCKKAGGCADTYTGMDTCQIRTTRACKDGRYGRFCSKLCHCVKKMCDSKSGYCEKYGGCKPGWAGGKACLTRCANGTFGKDCTGKCNCNDTSEACDKSSGRCGFSGCPPGYMGISCQQDCPINSYGYKCKLNCNCRYNKKCRKTDGFCKRGCESGYTGASCDQKCSNQTFGVECASVCRCLDPNERCNVETGECLSGCHAGRLPPTCQNECLNLTFGVNCSHVCHCRNPREPCYTTHGECFSGCAEGWTGSICQTKHKSVKSVTDVRGAWAAVGLVIIVIIVIFVIAKRRKSVSLKNPLTRNIKKAVNVESNPDSPLTTLSPNIEIYENILDQASNDRKLNTPVQEIGDDNNYEGQVTHEDEHDYLELQPDYESLVNKSVQQEIPMKDMTASSSFYSNANQSAMSAADNDKPSQNIFDTHVPPPPQLYENVHSYVNTNTHGYMYERSASETYENI